MCSDGTPVENHSRRGDDDFNFESERELFLYISIHTLFTFHFVFYFKKKTVIIPYVRAGIIFIFLNVICSFVSIVG